MAEQVIEQENNFNILKNASGDLMILMRARMDNAVKPQVLYDGGEHALLYRTATNTIVLDHIHPQIRALLSKAESILIVEAQGQSIVREYMTTVKTIKKLPLPEGIQLAD